MFLVPFWAPVRPHLGAPQVPWYSHSTILDEYALQDGWHPSCYREHPQHCTENIPKGGIRGLKALPSVTAPALAKPGTRVQCSIALSQMLWPKKYAKKKSQADMTEKCFPIGTGEKHCNCDQPIRKNFQPLKSTTFFKERHRDVLGKGTSPANPKSN